MIPTTSTSISLLMVSQETANHIDSGNGHCIPTSMLGSTDLYRLFCKDLLKIASAITFDLGDIVALGVRFCNAWEPQSEGYYTLNPLTPRLPDKLTMSELNFLAFRLLSAIPTDSDIFVTGMAPLQHRHIQPQT